MKVSGALLSAWLLCPPAFGIQSSAPWLCKSAIDQAWLGAFFFFPFSLPCDVLNCLLTDVIQPLRNSFCLVRLDESSHSQRLAAASSGDTAEIGLAGTSTHPAHPADLALPLRTPFAQRRESIVPPAVGRPEMKLP